MPDKLLILLPTGKELTMKTMLIEWPELGVKVEAALEDVRNADLINEIWEHLPMVAVQELSLIHI